MQKFKGFRDQSVPPPHPGEMLLFDVLPALGKRKSEIADLLGISRQALHGILTGKQPITPHTAIKFGKLCGTGPDIWLQLQVSYDLWYAEKEIDTSKIPTLKEVII